MKKLVAVVGMGLAAGSAMAQTNTVGNVSSSLTGSLGSALDTAYGIGMLAVGIGLVVFIVRKGVHVRG
jgi:hypothetical protein